MRKKKGSYVIIKGSTVKKEEEDQANERNKQINSEVEELGKGRMTENDQVEEKKKEINEKVTN